MNASQINSLKQSRDPQTQGTPPPVQGAPKIIPHKGRPPGLRERDLLYSLKLSPKFPGCHGVNSSKPSNFKLSLERHSSKKTQERMLKRRCQADENRLVRVIPHAINAIKKKKDDDGYEALDELLKRYFYSGTRPTNDQTKSIAKSIVKTAQAFGPDKLNAILSRIARPIGDAKGYPLYHHALKALRRFPPETQKAFYKVTIPWLNLVHVGWATRYADLLLPLLPKLDRKDRIKMFSVCAEILPQLRDTHLEPFSDLVIAAARRERLGDCPSDCLDALLKLHTSAKAAAGDNTSPERQALLKAIRKKATDAM